MRSFLRKLTTKTFTIISAIYFVVVGFLFFQNEVSAAVSIRSAGAYVSGISNLTPIIPASAATGDIMLLIYGTKPYNDAPTVTAGWTSIGFATDGTIAAGNDVGSMQTRIYYKEHIGSETNPTVTNTTNSVSGAVIIAFQKGASEVWETPVGAGGGDATAGTGFSVTTSVNPGITAGDMLVGYAAIRSDAGTQSAIAITATGLTVGAFTESPSADLATNSGGDMAMSGGYRLVTAGTASDAPVYASTLATSHTGSAFIVRLRATTPPAVPTVTSPTATSIATTGATLGANVTSLGVPASISARGTCWGESSAPTINCTPASGLTTGVFTHARTGMSPGTFYYYRGYATNSTGTGYSTDGTFTTTASASGSVSASPSSCTISSGASTCTVQFTWAISNATSPNLYNFTRSTEYSALASGTGVSYAITNGVNTVQVRDSSTVLDSTSVTASCEAGTSWSGGVCTAIVTYYTIFASSGVNGTVEPTGTSTIAQGGSQIYSITPNSLYEVATLLIDGGPVTATTTYTFTNVTANHTISATFSLLPVTHTITSSAGSNGTIDPLGAIVVLNGASQAFSITPEPGFYTASLLVDGGNVATTSPYTFTNVTTNHTITATFAQIPTPPGSFTIIASQNPNGTVAPSGSTTVTESASQTYTITPNSGYDVGSLIIDSFTVATSTSYTFTNVTADHTIEATFTALPETPVMATVRRLASITFSGKAFPSGKISIVRKELGNEIATKEHGTTDENGFFNIRFTDLQTGAHSFGLLIKDPEGRTSQTKFFLVDVSRGDEIFKDIIAPPTVDILNGQVSRGGNLKVFGYASPGHTIRIYLDDILVKEALAGRGGVYSFDIPTGVFDFGQHKVRAKQINLDGGVASDFSTGRTFIVSKLAIVKADLSGDGKIDIKDWSIFLARWGAKNSLGRAGIDLNEDGKVDIGDFSIFIKTIRKK